MIGVISGDIIKSQKIPKQQYDAMLYQLEQSLRANCNKTTSWDIYRGDAFQLQVEKSERLVTTAILIYLQLKSAGYELRQSMALGHIDNRGILPRICGMPLLNTLRKAGRSGCCI